MKQLRWIPVICLVLLLFGCGAPRRTIEPLQFPNKTATEETEPSLPTQIPNEEKYPDVVDCASAEGFVTESSKDSNTPCRVSLHKYRNDQPDYPSYDLYIEVDTGSQLLKAELSAGVVPLSENDLYFGDVDGDGIEEILIHENTGGCGGFGLWYTWVLKVDGEALRILFENYNEFDTGFESHLLDGYQLEVKNSITGYTLVYDAKDRYGDYIDNSLQRPEFPLCIDPFYIFEPTDVDDDGISEILCKQYTSHLGHADYAGDACSILKFNAKTQEFEVIDAWFEPPAVQ